MKKYSVLLLILGLLLVGCAAQQEPKAPGPVFPPELSGNWEMTGVLYKGELIDLDSVDGLKDLYDLVSLQLAEDGSFTFYNMFFYKGTAVEFHPQSLATPVYMMNIHTSSRIHSEDGEVKKLEKTYDGYPYVLIPVDADTLIFTHYDEHTMALDETPFVMTRKEYK